MQAPPTAAYSLILLSQARGKKKEESEPRRKFSVRIAPALVEADHISRITLRLLAPQNSLGRTQVLVAVINSDDDHMLGGCRSVFRRFGSRFEVVIFGPGVGELAYGINIIPVT